MAESRTVPGPVHPAHCGRPIGRRLIGGLACVMIVAAWGCGGGPTPNNTAGPAFQCPRDKLIDDTAAAAFPQESLPIVWAALEDREQKECWEAGLRIAGYSSDPTAFARIRGFIEQRSQMFALSSDQIVLQRAVEAIGNIIKRHPDPGVSEQALEYLVEATDTATWAKRSGRWTLDAVMRRELVRLLTRASVKALAQTRRPEADARIRFLAIDAADRRSLAYKFAGVGGENDRVEELINLHVLPPGRVAFAMDATLSQLGGELETMSTELRRVGGQLARLEADWGSDHTEKKALDDDRRRIQARYRPLKESLSRVEEVKSLAKQTFQLEQEWLVAARGNEQFQQGVRAADALADRRLSGFHGQLDSLRHLVKTVEEHEAIAQVEEVIFPRGPLPIIQLPHPEQIQHVLEAMQRLRSQFSVEMEMLRLDPHVNVVVEAHERLGRSLELGRGGQGFEKVLEARSSLQTALRVLVATVVARYPGHQAVERRQRLLILGPVMDQNAQVDNFLLRNEPIRDVDPTTGQELAPPEEGGEAVETANR